ncbi:MULTISPECIES: RsfA family transcription factor [unclassified Paenibacillus]|uniref:RsfA family transcription factor n=1 Tax=unclassified Paenibacillus TaxID=185978 RepID=UPI0002DE50BD|nr:MULTISPECIES: RsfA family transcription factor [unclassified Paenibacillus]EPD81283.1 RsfA family transcription factor [Paenibacillus sp. HGH0039]
MRKDNWTSQEDKTLAHTILKHIASGSTQLQAFDEVSTIVGRSSAACGFRWNSELRKRYSEEIRNAKTKSIESKMKRSNNDYSKQPKLDYEETFGGLLDKLKSKIILLEHELDQVKTENARLKTALQDSRPDLVMSEDFKNMIKIIERARSLGVLEKTS